MPVLQFKTKIYHGKPIGCNCYKNLSVKSLKFWPSSTTITTKLIRLNGRRHGQNNNSHTKLIRPNRRSMNRIQKLMSNSQLKKVENRGEKGNCIIIQCHNSVQSSHIVTTSFINPKKETVLSAKKSQTFFKRAKILYEKAKGT